MILFTSGTSAQPKGVVLNYREHLANIDPAADGFGITADDRVYDFRSFNWASAQLLGALVPVNRGATLVMAAKFSASRFFRHVRDHGVTVAAGNPTTINILLNTETTAHRDNLPTLRFLTSSSAPLTLEEWRRFEERFGIPIAQGYGSSETGWIAAVPGEQRRLGTVGLPFAYHRLAIVDAAGRRLPPGEIGQIEIGGFETGGNASHDYRYLADDGSVQVNSRGRIRTGDLGLLDADGFLALTGREKDLIIRGGVNISPVEIDGFLMRRPELIEVATVGVPDAIYGEEVVSYVVARPGTTVDAGELLALLQRRASGLQGAEADRAQRLAAEDRTRQARPPRPGGTMESGDGRLRCRAALTLFQEAGECFDVADDRVACEAKRLEGALGSSLIARAAGVGDDHRNEAQVCCVARGWLDPNLGCDPDDGDRQDSAVAQRKRERRSFKRRHGDLVEYGLVRRRSQLGDDLKAGRVAQEPRCHGVRLVLPLPSHGCPKLRYPHPCLGQRQMPCEDDAHARRPRRRQYAADLRYDLVALLDLIADAHLHVIDEQRHAPRIADVIQRCRYAQTMNMFHCSFPGAVRSNGSATSTEGSKRNSNGKGASSAMKSHSIRPAFVSGKSAM